MSQTVNYKKRILMISTTPFFQEKGSSLRVFAMAEILGSKYNVDLVTYPHGRDIKIPGVKVHRTWKGYKPAIKVSKICIGKIMLDSLVYLKALHLVTSNKYDVVHCEDFEAALIGRVLVLGSKLNLVYDLHNRVLDNLEINRPAHSFVRAIVHLVERFIVARCNLVICNWSKYLSDPFFQNSNTLLFYDRLNTRIEDPQLELPERYIVYAGNFEMYQGVHDFLILFATVKTDYKIVLVGSFTSSITDIISNKNLHDRVVLTGPLSVVKTNHVIKNSQAGLFSRLRGTQSMKELHYFVQGKPVIANCYSKVEFVRNSKNGLMYSSENLSDVLENLDMQLLNCGAEETAQLIFENWNPARVFNAFNELQQ